MAIDFLRHIVNPIVNNHVERGLSPKVANELKKAIAAMETKYRFDVFSGNILNLAFFLKSADFDDLVSTFKAFNAESVLVEILEKARQAYSGVQEVVEAVNLALSKLEGVEKREDRINIEDIAIVLKKHVKGDVRALSKNVLGVELDNHVDVKIRLFKNCLKLEIKINTLSKPEVARALKKVARIAEEISGF